MLDVMLLRLMFAALFVVGLREFLKDDDEKDSSDAA